MPIPGALVQSPTKNKLSTGKIISIFLFSIVFATKNSLCTELIFAHKP